MSGDPSTPPATADRPVGELGRRQFLTGTARLAIEWWHVNGIERPEGTWSFAAGWQRTLDVARFTPLEPDTAASTASLAAHRPRLTGENDAWFDPLVSAPAGAGALAAGVAGLALVKRRKGRDADGGDAERDG